MRIVIDMQGAQTDSRFRGIGRYTLSLALAIVRNRGEHEVMLALNGLFTDTIESIRAAFDGLLPQENIRVWTAPGPVREVEPANHMRRDVAERIREAFLASLNPDIVLVGSLFEGFGDDAITSIGILDWHLPTAVILYDLIPLINPDAHFKSSQIQQEYYARKIASLKRSQILLAISDSSRQEAITALDYQPQNIVNISGACDASFRVIDLSDDQKTYLFRKYNILKPFVMYTGGADERKNLHRLIEAYAYLPEGVRQEHQLLIVGKMPDDSAKDLLRTALKHGLSEGDVVISGYVEDDDLVKLYNSCVLFVFPSLHEGFGIPPLEAMLCGAPVIAANATSLPEVIGRNDALFDPSSVPAISEKLKRALTDDAFRADLIAHGHVHAKTFSWDESAKRAIQALRKFSRSKTTEPESALCVDRTAVFQKSRKKILLIKLDHMGDFFLSIPTITKLRAKYPYASIDIVVGSWNVTAAASLKIFDNIYAFDYFKRKSSDSPSTTKSELDRILHDLPEYDIAIDLRRPSDTRFLLAKVRAKQKVGYTTFDPTINAELDIALSTYADVSFEKTPLNNTSIAKQILRLVDALPEDVNDFIYFPELVAKRTLSGSISIALFPLAGSDVKEWDKSRYIALVELLRRETLIYSINIYFVNVGEAKRFDFKPDEKVRIHIGLDFHALAESVSVNTICVANNSFGAHFASYLGLTVIAIYSGHETSDEWAPVFGDSYVIHTGASCSPCHLAQRGDCPYGLSCLSDISVDFVHRKIIEAAAFLRQKSAHIDEAWKSTISLSRGPRDAIDDLTASINEIGLGMRTQSENMAIAAAISRNQASPAQSRQLLVDISEFVKIDARSGIQRVVRNMLVELVANPPAEYRVEPVYADPGQKGYRYARTFAARFSGGDSLEADDFVDAYNGDLFIGLDLQYSAVAAQKSQLQEWHRSGVKIFFVIYDLLPVLFPRGFPLGAQAAHHAWLENISRFDGAICISRAVADEYYEWLRAFGKKRKRPFAVNWFHLGADIENAMPTMGMPDDAERVLTTLASCPSFLIVGTIEPRKGHAQVLSAFEQLWNEGVSANLVIIGKNGWMVESLVDELRNHRESGKSLFWFEGISDEFLKRIYAASSCLIMASEGEGFGLPLIEAAQHGLPIIARDLPVFREVAENHALYFVNEKTPIVIVNAVREWLTLRQTGAYPRSSSMRWLTWKESAKHLLHATLNNEPYYAWLPNSNLYYWGNDPRLYTNVGERISRSMRTSANGGCLLHGPYIELPAGRYRISWRGVASLWTGLERLDVVFNQGRTCVLHVALVDQGTGPWRYDVEFVLDSGVTDLEFRVYVHERTELTLNEIEIVSVSDFEFESDATNPSPRQSVTSLQPSTEVRTLHSSAPLRVNARPLGG